MRQKNHDNYVWIKDGREEGNDESMRKIAKIFTVFNSVWGKLLIQPNTVRDWKDRIRFLSEWKGAIKSRIAKIVNIF